MRTQDRTDLSGARVLVTGATGLVGSEILEHLADRYCDHVVGVSRQRSARGPGIVAWDMSRDDPPQELRGKWDVIIHTAANTRWTMSPDEALAANVVPVAALRSLVAPDTLVLHVSTAYAVGLRGDALSESLEDYRNSYEWSKAGGEQMARRLFPRLAIVRPPLTIGRRGDGRAARFSGMYLFLRGITSSTVPAIVGVPDAFFDVTPVDDLAALIVDIVSDPNAGQGEVLTIAGGEGAPRVEPALKLMIDALNGWRGERGLTTLDDPPLLSPERWNRFFLPFAREHLTERQLRTLDLLRNFEAYLQLTEPLQATHIVADVEDTITASVRQWASVHPRAASLSPQPWRSDRGA
jgi:nucleoside-diphosphate-sugar epimerase